LFGPPTGGWCLGFGIYNEMLKKIFIAYTFLIVLLAVLPINGANSLLNNNYILEIRMDYLAHFAIFMPMMVLVWYDQKLSFKKTPAKTVFWLLAGIFIGIITESVQYFLPYRAFNINDLAANTIGVLLGSLIFFFKAPVPET
jgi:VanZ family protein